MAEILTPLPSPQLRPPEPITGAHDVANFSSRREELNLWLQRRALASDDKTSRTYVVPQAMRVVGYYALAVGGVEREALPKRLRRNTPEQIPVVVLGRLATDRDFERRGIGGGMLRDAIARMLGAAQEVGVRALLVHAIDEEAACFYLKFGFVAAPSGDRTLLLPVETARAAVLAK